MLIGIDIGGTKCACVGANRTADGGVEIVAREAFETAKFTPYGALDEFYRLIRQITHGEKPESIGISCGGPLDSEKGVILSPPNLPGWDEIEIVRHFEEEFGVSARLLNDANASALAEWRYGAGKGTKNMIFLTFGTGLGAGLILNGALFEGTNGMAGEVGHMRLSQFGPSGYGKCGSFEGFCSGGGIAELARSLAKEALQRGEKPSYIGENGLDGANITAKTVAIAARSGDATACEVFRICAEKLGEGLSILIDLFNPEVIVLGSIYARCEDLLYETAMRTIRKEALSQSASVCRLAPALLGEQIGDYAALSAGDGEAPLQYSRA